MQDADRAEAWTAVEDYLTVTLVGEDQAQVSARESADREGLPAIEVSAPQGKLLMLLAKLTGARKVLEIGTLGGYSTIWLARGVSDGGEVVSCEYEPHHAEVARRNLEAAGVADKVSIRVGAALETLPSLAAGNDGPFDLVFIDADKENNRNYVEWALRLTRPGSLIVVDNVVRSGQVLAEGGDGSTVDRDIRGTRDALALLGSDERLDATAIQTVGGKGWDGFALALVK
ncbi:O-methyltransferase [Arthrobacter sulfonylureivorans]|uniref:O-methyltransferase n=1 Tax=Arthrobacter sulfonylureivorans TaxID=2486855 RepID=A0ABY3WER8_9MICC|nr:O-methyltransferase [Arthrobacter sulfonylureivorans]UNK47720.1 O-methyltransferase [Arthrobacter sulfonylureivorans]